MFDVHRLPSAVVAATFAVSGLVATTGVASVALGAGAGDAYCSDVDADRPAGGILDCLGPSTGYVETAIGSGSALVLDDGYLLTNAHVVDPFDHVKVTLGDDAHEDVPVVGVDLFADIAVLGPIQTDAPPVHLVDPADLQKGDELFLVGYPGEANAEDLEPTIADGILSRTRTSKEFGLHYLQTDASIGGGQSGGALVDVEGGVVGISSLRFAENFALALSGADAQAAFDKILAGKGSTNVAWPGGEPAGQVSAHLPDSFTPAFLYLPVADEDTTVDLTVPADLPVVLVSGAIEDEDPLEVMGNLQAVAAEGAGVPLSYLEGVPDSVLLEDLPADGADLATRLGPGSFRFKVPAGKHVSVVLVTPKEGGLDVPVTSSLPLVASSMSEPAALELGKEVEGVMHSLAPNDRYTLHLEAGDEVRVVAGSPSGDVGVYIEGPGDEQEDFDDSRAGLYGVDVDEVYEARATGDYVFEVYENDGSSTGYRLQVSAS